MRKIHFLLLIAGVAGCAGNEYDAEVAPVQPTPTVDYVAQMDPYGGSKDPFLGQLAMNYRSYAMYNAQVSGYADIGELFAQKAVSAFAGEMPMPESLDNWAVGDQDLKWELQNGCRDLLAALQNDASIDQPKLAAEAQAKFDCWLSATASGQMETAEECRMRFSNAMEALNGNGGIMELDGEIAALRQDAAPDTGFVNSNEYPSTAELRTLTDTKRTRDGVVIVNNINVPKDLIRPAPVNPVVFNQNIYSNGTAVSGGALGDEVVTRDEFLNMMMSLREEIKAIKNARPSPAGSAETAMIKVQQIPSPAEPKQRIVEEIFEVNFDFNKSTIKPEYEVVIQKLAAAARENANVKISVIGHTDTVGGANYNYALGGRRAESVKQMLVAQGIPASSIIVVSSGKNDLKVPTGKNVKNAENRRARVVKEVRYMEQPAAAAGTAGQ